MIKFDEIKVTMRANVSDPGHVAPLSACLFGDTFRDQVERVRAESDPTRRRALKAQLPCFTPSGTFSGLDAQTLISHSGLLCVDLDYDPASGKPEKNARVSNWGRLKELIAQVSCVAYMGLSCGGVGYFALIPISAPAQHEAHFRAIQEDFRRCGIEIDKACKNVNRTRFVSFDPYPYINLNATTYTKLKAEAAPRSRDRRHARPAANVGGDLMRLADAIRVTHTDITGSYEQWWKCLCAIATELGEAGEDLAHLISSYYVDYSPTETSRKYAEALRHGKGTCTASTLFYYARQAGVKIY